MHSVPGTRRGRCEPVVRHKVLGILSRLDFDDGEA